MDRDIRIFPAGYFDDYVRVLPVWASESETGRDFFREITFARFYISHSPREFLSKWFALAARFKEDAFFNRHPDSDLVEECLRIINSDVDDEIRVRNLLSWFFANADRFVDPNILNVFYALLNGRKWGRTGAGFPAYYFSEYSSDFEPSSEQERKYERFIRSLESDEFYEYHSMGDFIWKCFNLFYYLRKHPDGYDHVDKAALEQIYKYVDVAMDEAHHEDARMDDNAVAVCVQRYVNNGWFKDKKLEEIFKKLLEERTNFYL